MLSIQTECMSGTCGPVAAKVWDWVQNVLLGLRKRRKEAHRESKWFRVEIFDLYELISLIVSSPDEPSPNIASDTRPETWKWSAQNLEREWFQNDRNFYLSLMKVSIVKRWDLNFEFKLLTNSWVIWVGIRIGNKEILSPDLFLLNKVLSSVLLKFGWLIFIELKTDLSGKLWSVSSFAYLPSLFRRANGILEALASDHTLCLSAHAVFKLKSRNLFLLKTFRF